MLNGIRTSSTSNITKEFLSRLFSLEEITPISSVEIISARDMWLKKRMISITKFLNIIFPIYNVSIGFHLKTI